MPASRLLPLLPALLLAACVDATGISPQLQKSAHPESNAGASVIVREYADLQCPACATAALQLTPQLLERHGAEISLEFMHFPLRGIHPWALAAAEAAECAADQGKFWEYVDLAYAEQDALTGTSLTEWADRLGLDAELFKRCTKSHVKRPAILKEYDEGVAQKVRGTPTYLVNGVIVPATLEALSEAIVKARQSTPVRM